MSQCLKLAIEWGYLDINPCKKIKRFKESKNRIRFFSDEEVKVVWREEDKTKVGRGKITHDDENFVYLAGEKGKVVVNKKDIIAIKQ